MTVIINDFTLRLKNIVFVNINPNHTSFMLHMTHYVCYLPGKIMINYYLEIVIFCKKQYNL